MAANTEAVPHTPTALERLKIAFIEATAHEQDDFVVWAAGRMQRRVDIERMRRPWPTSSWVTFVNCVFRRPR